MARLGSGEEYTVRAGVRRPRCIAFTEWRRKELVDTRRKLLPLVALCSLGFYLHYGSRRMIADTSCLKYERNS